MTTLHVMPAGGGDHTTVQAAVDALGAGDHEIICYSGGDLGGLTLSNATPDSIEIRAAAGHQHDGRNNGNTGIAHALATWTITRSFITIRGCAFAPASGVAMGPSGSAGNIIIDACRFVQANNAAAFSAVLSNTNMGPYTLRNNVFYSAANRAVWIRPSNTTGGPYTATATVENNTAIDTAAATHGFSLDAVVTSGAGVTANFTCRNNVAIGFGTADFTSVATGAGAANVTFNRTFGRNASGDGTADDFGGSGHLVSQAAADWFADVAADLRQVHRSPGVLAGIGAPLYKPEAAGVAGRPAARRCGKECGVDLRA